MAIINGRIIGNRVTGTRQGFRGITIVSEFFVEPFSGTFEGIIQYPLTIFFTLTDGPEPYEGGHTTCRIFFLTGSKHTLHGPSPLAERGSNYSVSYAGGALPIGINIRFGEAPVQISLAPCGPIPRVLWGRVPLIFATWNGNTFSRSFQGAQF